MAQAATQLSEISPDKIKKNPANPRLIFREDEMNELRESIRTVGIRVPVAVYPDGKGYTIIDGERRWRCALQLNHKVVPAIIQPKPLPLENLLMMFNIHNVRVDWDLMPTALKIGEVRDMLGNEGKPNDPKALAAITGVRLPTVRRALDLLGLPKNYQKMLLKEAEKPKAEQKITADLFIEVYKSLHAVERHAPEVFKEVDKNDYIDAMVQKYISEVEKNVVQYRDVSKIARAELAGVDKRKATPAIVRLVKNRKYSISDAYKDTVQAAYEERDILGKIRLLTERVTQFKKSMPLDKEVRTALVELRTVINRLLG